MRRRGLLLAAVAALALALLVGGNTWRNWAGITLAPDTPAERSARLAPFWRVVPPDAPASAAGAILLPGCDGVRDNMEFWADALAAAGAGPALILDSHRPRRLDRLESWRLVCGAQVLTGAERAGDLAVALAQATRAGVDLLGASHGGWAIMEFLRLAATGDVPPGLTAWPAPPAELLGRTGRVVLLYPYCGAFNHADQGDWRAAPPVLLLAAEDDEIVSTPDCIALAQALRARGARIEVRVIPGVGHGFDQQEKSALSALTFDAAAREAARELTLGFLRAP